MVLHDDGLRAGRDSEPSDRFYAEVEECMELMRLPIMDSPGFVIRDSYSRECCDVEVGCSDVSRIMLMRLSSDFGDDLDHIASKNVLMHCALVPRNVLVSPDGEHMASIVDWEMASYCPHTYEFFKYLYESKYNSVPSSKFTSKWLSIFWMPSVPGVAALEDLFYHMHGIRFSREVVPHSASSDAPKPNSTPVTTGL